MYCLSETQIDFILDDISARGIEMVSLQQNLLDHVCCVIEQSLEDDGDFEHFYLQTIATFYEMELKEIEVETTHLLIHKNYYVMKKIMLIVGTTATGILGLGLLLKFMHWPGAAMCIVFSVFLLSFIFFPLLFILKIKEKQQNTDKVILFIGTLSAMIISVGLVFKIMHWPYANMLITTAFFMMLLLFLPIYFFTGIRNPQTKVNTIVSSILLAAGFGLILVLVRAPAGTRSQHLEDTRYFVRNEQILKSAQQQNQIILNQATTSNLSNVGNEVFTLCDKLKHYLVEKETGLQAVPTDFESKEIMLGDAWVNDYLSDDSFANDLEALKTKIAAFNNVTSASNSATFIPIDELKFNKQVSVKAALNNLFQVQMIVLQNQTKALASR